MPKPSLMIVLLALTLAAPALAGDEQYQLGPDSQRQEDVPRGGVTRHTLRNSEVYPETIRDYYVYIPAQYDGSEPAALMVFQDGHTYVDPEGQFRVPIVFDNLIAAGDMPPTIGVFINPGHKITDGERPDSPWENSNRSIEYDTLSDRYAEFLLADVLPRVEKQHDVQLSDDPERRAICGISSGGICAWTVVWQRPDQFRKVLSHVGSFVDIRGGHNYPPMIRKHDKKPIRVFLQDGSNDLSNRHGSWPLANKQMDAALDYKDYDHKFVFGEGGHNGKHGGAILPDSLRWLWRE